MASICTSNVTSGFIDLATFDELEKYMYGCPEATAYFVRETRKSTWFTQVPVALSRASGNPAFGQDFSVSISRAGDYLLHTWLRCSFPAIQAAVGSDSLSWTKNLMHNLVQECCITFNDLVAARFDSYHLDFWAAFTVPASKRVGYQNMIGNIPALINQSANGVTIPATILNLPLPLFYSRNSGVALPTAALPYNDMRINFTFRNWNQLLIRSDPTAAIGATDYPNGGVPVVADLATPAGVAPVLGTCNVWANYAIVSNTERQRMGCAPRDILIEQVQTAPRQNFTPATQVSQSYDVRFSHAVKALFFAVRNTTVNTVWSNYTSASPVVAPAGSSINYAGPAATDPILDTSLVYENTSRLASLGSDYFSLVNPWYHAPAIAQETGYHLYSYSLDFFALDPMGSTNYGKLTNVSISITRSPGALAGATGASVTKDGQEVPQTFEFVVTCVNNNVVRVSGGALGFPVL